MATEISSAKTFTFIILLVLIGPVMFVVARSLSLARAFDKVQVGDAAATVKTTMGAPQEEASANLYLHGDTEYRYSIWPVPKLWVVSLKDGKVIEKQTMSSP
jgi:hypothetical protein